MRGLSVASQQSRQPVGANEAAERTIDCSAYRTCIGMIVKSLLGKFLRSIFCHELFRSMVSESVKGNGTLPSHPGSRSARQQEFPEPAGYSLPPLRFLMAPESGQYPIPAPEES